MKKEQKSWRWPRWMRWLFNLPECWLIITFGHEWELKIPARDSRRWSAVINKVSFLPRRQRVGVLIAILQRLYPCVHRKSKWQGEHYDFSITDDMQKQTVHNGRLAHQQGGEQ